ncbi:uncharacterized protein PV09_07563 [Verruconis gallopava]|uniref:Uncharacterized protein n=1 Tax=Verruconis gallopava TaxID=253628 RepID=A0A0D2API8_9PEZI|nr:uncharacterized protein PV09_07563 [Verruconis gallopava]KIW01049.1 hypothetical protein PV09_07563 [Verruconis gallopava]
MAEQRPDNGKGKGKARLLGNADNTEAQGQAKLASRVVESARGLLEDMMKPGSDTTHTLSSNAAMGGKPQSSGMLTNLNGSQSDHSVKTQSQGSAGGASRSASQPKNSFRTPGSADDTLRHFEEFASSKGSALSADTCPPQHLDDLDKSGRRAWIDPVRVPHGHSSASYQNHYDDGAEVRALLSDPNLSVDHDALDFLPSEETSQPTVDELFAQNLSSEAQQAVADLKSNLPPPPVYQAIPSNHPLALVPRSDEVKREIEQNIHGILSGTFTGEHLSPGSESEIQWLSSWTSVLDRYTDEVWGDILPIVKETKKHLEQVKAGNATMDSQAVARLKMILGHLQQHESK